MFKLTEKLVFILVCIGICIPLITSKENTMCGLRKISRSPKIVNGKDAYHGQYPWAVSLRLNQRHHCGGALLNQEWILTAAHCVSKINERQLTVKLGGHYRASDSEPTSIELPVKMVLAHEGFTFTSFANDIALVKLSKKIDFSNYISPICLPFADEADYANQTGVVIGWGRLSPSGKSAATLQQLELPIIDNPKCMKWYQTQGKSIAIRSTQFCAGMEEGGKDACQGDSGSPMMSIDRKSKQIRVIGIVSAGIGCALPKLPGLYTKVSAFIPWVKQYITITPPKIDPAEPVITIDDTVTEPHFNLTEIFNNQTNINTDALSANLTASDIIAINTTASNLTAI